MKRVWRVTAMRMDRLAQAHYLRVPSRRVLTAGLPSCQLADEGSTEPAPGHYRLAPPTVDAAAHVDATPRSAVCHQDRLDRIDLAGALPSRAGLGHFRGRACFAVSATHHVALLQNVDAVGERNRIGSPVRGLRE